MKIVTCQKEIFVDDDGEEYEIVAPESAVTKLCLNVRAGGILENKGMYLGHLFSMSPYKYAIVTDDRDAQILIKVRA